MPVRATAKKPTTSNRNGLITDEEEEDEEVPGTQFEAHESDSSSNFYNVIRILKESNSKYQVEWDGIDPKTGKPWKPSWIPKEDCTNVLIREWKTEKQKRKQEKKMKKKRKDGRGQPSVASSEARTSSRSKSAETTMSSRLKKGALVEETSNGSPRKRQRSKADSVRSADIEESAEEGAFEPARPTKRRKFDNKPPSEAKLASMNGHKSSPATTIETPPRELPKTSVSPTTTTNSRRGSSRRLSSETIIPDSEQNSSNQTMHELNSMSHNTGPQSHILRSVPQPNVSIFRDRFPPPLSQIEQFSSPIASPHRSKPVSRAKATQISDISSFSHVGEGDKSVKSHSSDKGSREPPVDNTQFPANEENNENNTGNIGDDDLSQNNDESPISYRAETPVVISRPVNTASEDARPTAPEVSLIPIRRSMSLKLDSPDEPKQWRSSLAAKDAIITSLETRIQILQKEREVREQSFQTSIREHVLSKSALEEQVLSLTSALKQLSGSLPDTVNLVQQEQRMSLEPLEPTDLVRRADDEALIAQLNAEVSKLQDQLLHAQRAKANSDAMVEQVRDVARRAEATKMDLVRQSRIDREVALNAPKIAEELHMTALAEAQMTIDRQKVQIAILEEQHQLTGDIIRKKAAKFDGLQKRYQKLTIDHDELVDRLYNADDARAESASQLAHIRNVVAKISEALGNRESFAQVPGILSEILSQHLEPGADTGTMGSSEEEEEGEEGDDQDMEGVSTTTGLSLGTDIMGVNFDEDPREQNRPTLFIQELIGNVEPGIELSFPDAVESPEPVLVERSDDQVFPCLWHPSDDVCKAYHSTKEDLLGHIFRDHLNF